MTIDTTWPDWYLDASNDASIHESLRELARYTNPVQTKRQGLGLGAIEQQPGGSRHDQATALAERLVARRTRYTHEPFNPGLRRGQMIRTTQELFDGAGTCVDFAVTMSALLNRELIPATVAVAIPRSDTEPAHAFVLVHADGRPTEQLPRSASYAQCAGVLSDPASPWLLLDTTPLSGDRPGDLGDRRTATLRMLAEDRGRVHVIDTGRGSEQEELEFHLPPPAQRDLGITAYLPDPVAGFVDFPSHRPVRDALATATGRVLLVGPSGAGKSTLALETAGRLIGHRGWFLEGSDEATFQRSLAAAESQSRGEEVGPAEAANTATRVARAHQRLARSERPWVVVVDNADSLTADLLGQLPGPRQANGEHPGDLLIVTSTDDERASALVEQRTAAGEDVWTMHRLDRLTPGDTATGGVTSALADDARLPGLVKIAQWSAAELARDEPGTAGPLRLVDAALTTAKTKKDGLAMRRAAEAAAFMPAERITLGWVARAAFEGDVKAAVAALRVAEKAGLIERSRADGEPGSNAPLWMHRLVRAAVAKLTAREAGLRTLAEWRGEMYSRAEISTTHTFVMAGGAPTTRHGVLAAATVVDLWEGGGKEAVASACELGSRYVDLVDGVLGLDTTAGASVYVRGQLAVARQVSHGDPADDQLDAAVDRCVAATSACTALLASRPTGPDSDQLRLLAGRAAAMHGILLRTKADQLPDKTGQLDLLREAIKILRQSYSARLQAFRQPDGTLKPDPDRHVDRSWYNLGGAYVKVANILHRLDPSDAGEAAIAAELSHAMESYAGSLSLRRGEPTNYTAASLWGVGLVAYSAALYCPGKLDLSKVVPTDELSHVLAEPTRTNLLLAAENCVTAALRIWTELNGSPNNARKLLLKLSLAWAVKDADPADWAKKLKKALEPGLKDLEIEEFYASENPPDQPGEASASSSGH